MAIWLLAGCTVLAGIAAVAYVYGVGLLQKAIAGSLTMAEADVFVALSTAIGLALVVAYVATAIAFLAWLSRAIDNVPALGAGWPAASPRWAIAWWFIPFANLGMPYDVVRELRARMRGDGPRRHPPLLLAWWFTFVGGEVMGSAIARMPSATPQQVSVTLMVAAIGSAFTVCAGVLAILVIRGIERAAAARPAITQSGAPIPPTGSVGEWDGGQQRTGWRMRASWVGFVAITAAFAVGIAVPVLAAQPGDGTATSTDQTAGASSQPSGLDSTDLPPQAPALEARLPESVAGRPLERWSVRGEDYFVTFSGLSADELAQVKADLAESGLTVDDVGFAVGGRSDPNDPPYFVFAIQFRGIAAETLPDGMAIDHPDAGTFVAVTIAGKSVRRGAAGMVEQSEDARGVPYLYDRGDVRYIVVTDDADWAADVLRQLP